MEDDIQDLEWRKLLWLRHGCPLSALYGDDGEMQCRTCRIDFKRETPNGIRLRFRDIANERLGRAEV